MRESPTPTLDHSTSSIVGSMLVHDVCGRAGEPHTSWTENWVQDSAQFGKSKQPVSDLLSEWYLLEQDSVRWALRHFQR